MQRFLLAALLAVFALAGCGPMYETQYSFVPPPTQEGRMCINQCQMMGNMCRQGCETNKQACLADSRSRAMMDYQSYVNQRNSQKLPIDRTVQSFDQSYRCNNSSCGERCDADYRNCFTGCGGQVYAQQVCVAFCN